MSSKLPELIKNGVKVVFVGDLSLFSRPVRTALDKFEVATSHCSKLNLIVALNYSGRWDIVEAVRQLADCGHDLSNVEEKDITAHLATSNFVFPDLLIRTSGELRISNFLLWQTAYTELYFTDVLWPDFGPSQLDEAIADYEQRERRIWWN